MLSVADVAKRKSCSTTSVVNAIHRGELNAVRIGRRTFAVLDDHKLQSFSPARTVAEIVAKRRKHREGVTV